MRSRRRVRAARRLAAPAIFVALAAVIGCGSDSDGDAVKREVKIGIEANPGSLDPVQASTAASLTVVGAFYDTVVRQGASGEVEPGLASRWTVTPTSARLTLRSGVTCSDGTPLTARAVAASLRRLADPATKSPLGSFTFGPGTATISGDNASRTVRVALSKPWSHLLSGLAGGWAGIVCPSGLRDPDRLGQKPAGTGPYELVSARPGTSYVLRRRSGYTAPAADADASTLPERLEYKVVANESTTANLLTTGGLDAATLTGPDIARLERESDLTVETDAVGSSFVLFNQAEGHPGADPVVRRALASAIDPIAYNRSASEGRGEVTTSFAAPATPCYDEGTAELVPAFDEAEREPAQPDTPIRVIGSTGVADGAGNAYVQAALEQAGWKSRLRNVDGGTWANALFSGENEWDVTVVNVQDVTNSLVFPAQFLAGAAPPDGTNVGNIRNRALDAGVADAAATQGEEQCAAWARAQQAVVEELDILPLTTLPVAVAVRRPLALDAQSGIIDPRTIRVD